MGALDDMMLQEGGRLLRSGPGAVSGTAAEDLPVLAVRVGEHVLACSVPPRSASEGAEDGVRSRGPAAHGALVVEEEQGGWVISRRLQAGGGDFRVELRRSADAEAALPAQIAMLLRACAPIEECLTAYLNPELGTPPEGWAQAPAAATVALDHARCLSERLVLALLFDREGLVHSVSGQRAGAEDQAAAAARLCRQADQLLSAWKLMTPQRFWFSAGDETTLIAALPGTGLSLLLRVKGTGVARGLAEAAYRMVALAFGASPEPEGGTVAAAAGEGPLRRRYSWFQAPVLLPRSPFVSRRDSGVFHVPQCRRLTATLERRLEWFANRADALRASLRPCQACKP